MAFASRCGQAPQLPAGKAVPHPCRPSCDPSPQAPATAEEGACRLDRDDSSLNQCTRGFTSPRLRGEVEIQAQLEFRVRGSSPESSLTVFAETALTPTLSPQRAGRGSKPNPRPRLDLNSSRSRFGLLA